MSALRRWAACPLTARLTFSNNAYLKLPTEWFAPPEGGTHSLTPAPTNVPGFFPLSGNEPLRQFVLAGDFISRA